jgi:nickel-dependent lactate racemase
MTAPRTLSLPYGRGTLEFTVPASADILEIRQPQRSVNSAAFEQGLAEVLPAIIPEGQIALVVADKTRLCGYPTVLPWLLEALESRGVARHRIVFFIAYGNHAPQTESESLTAYGPVFRNYPFIHHCSTEPDLFVELGVTGRGTPARLRRDLVNAGLIITVGAISHHYFAGFGGGRKLLFPGLGEQQAISRNHGLFLDKQRQTLAPGCRPGLMDGNPLAEDLAEIDRMLPPYISIHGLLDSFGEVAAYRFGRSYSDFLSACEEHDQYFRAKTGTQYDLVLASAGGYPKDINLIQAHKAIDNGAAFVRDGGTLILLAECPEGIGSTTFLPYFAMGGWQAAFDHLARNYSGNGGTALALMAKTGRITICLITALDRNLCEQIGLNRIRSDQVDRLRLDAGSRIAVIRNSSMLVR